MYLERGREDIDKIDAKIVKLLKKRLGVAREIINYKRKRGKDIHDSKRELQIIKRVRKIAEKEGLDPDFAEEIFARILEKSKRIN